MWPALAALAARLPHAGGETLLLSGGSEDKLAKLNQTLGGAQRTLTADLTAADGGAAPQSSPAQIGAIGGLAHCADCLC